MTLGLALGLLFGSGWLLLHYYRAENVSAALPHYSRTERFWVRLTVIVVSLHVTAACVTVSLVREVPAWRAASGLALYAAALAFWLWGRMLIGPLHVQRLPEEPPLQLRRAGAFGIVRHPLYLGVLGAAAAPLLVAPRAYLVLSLAGVAVVLGVRAVQEERRLYAQLGAPYAAYCSEVKRLIPFVW